MKGGRPTTAIIRPFKSPQPAPITSPRRLPPQIHPCWMKVAATLAESASTDPMERSMPAVRMTIVRPEARRNRREACRTMLTRFWTDRKYGLTRDSNTRSRRMVARRKSPLTQKCDISDPPQGVHGNGPDDRPAEPTLAALERGAAQ